MKILRFAEDPQQIKPTTPPGYSVKQVEAWKRNPDYQNFLRQLQIDAFVARKQGVPVEEIQETIRRFSEEVAKSIQFIG